MTEGDPLQLHFSGGETRGGHIIYLADRVVDRAASVASQIRFFGYQVEIFDAFDQLDAAINSQPPAVVVVDMSFLPPEGDAQTSDFFPLCNKGKPLPVIFLSSDQGLERRLQSVRLGGKAFFGNPVNVSALIDALDQIAWFVPPAPMRVLIVDDSRVHANFSAMHLRKAEIVTEVLYDPKDILIQLQEFQPELILLDMYMPFSVGMELAAVIRQIPEYISVPIVYLSSETDRDRQLEAVSLGGDDFLSKPIKPEHLITSVGTRIKRYRTLRELMLRDSLTGLYNHTTIKEHLRQEFARAKRSDYPLSCVVIDLDHFKEINDQYGHTTGDRVLKSLSQLLIRRLRQSDVVGRYGGEEFVIILPATEVHRAAMIINELRNNFAQIRHQSAEVEFCLTFSGGVSSWPPYSSPSLLFEMADRALYAAKNRGRNQVVIAE
jgi:diguanylate cyclase (GGDEF)-like protein